MPPNYDLAAFGQIAHDLQDLALLRLDFRHAHRTARVEVFGEQFGGALRHVREELLAQRRLRALQRDDQRLGLDFLQQQLDRAVFQVEQVLEHEHLIDDLLRQFRVVFAARFRSRILRGCST